MSYTIYLDKDETFECEANIKNASYKDTSARLIIESKNINLIFYGKVSEDTISVPIRSLKKYFNENDSANIKLEVIVENTIVTPWESELEFDSYNKVEIKEVKKTRSKPMIEVKVKSSEKQVISEKESSTKSEVIEEENKKTTSTKELLLKFVNEEIKKVKSNNSLTKEDKKELIRNILKINL